MIQIIVTNSTCQVKNLPRSVEAKIKQELRYKDQNVEFSLYKNQKEIKKLEKLTSSSKFGGDSSSLLGRISQLNHIVRSLEKKLFISLYHKGEFATGLLPNVLKILNYSKLEYEILDLRKAPKLKQHKFVLKESFPALRYYQKTATKELEDKHRGVVVMPTGTGKTMVVSKMIWDLGVNTLIITPSKSITDNMVDTLIKHFGKGKVDRLTTKTQKIKKPINVINIQALVNVKPSVFHTIDAVFIDEFHHAAADTYREVNLKHLKNCYYRIGVTATNFRNDGAGLALQSVLSEILFEYDIRTAIDEEYLVQPRFEFIKNSVRDDKTYQKTYKSQIVENKERNQDIVDAALEEYEHGGHVLILVQQMLHGEILKEMLSEVGAEFIHGKVKDIDRQKLMDNYRKGKLKILVGTSVIGEGVDLPIADTLIMAGGGKSPIQVMQNVGRVLRPFKGKEDALIIDFEDNGSKWLEEHSILRDEIYKEYSA